MNIKFLVAALAIATTFAACKKDKDNELVPEETQLPAGTFRLIESVQFDQAGNDSVSVRYPISNLNLAFNQETKIASVSGKQENVQVAGTYTANADHTLTNGVVDYIKIVTTPTDSLIIGLLNNVDKFEVNNQTVTVNAKGKGRLVFSMQK